MGMINMNQAIQAIKNEQCCKCGKRAKGLIYRGKTVNYYCKKCLSEHNTQKVTNTAAS